MQQAGCPADMITRGCELQHCELQMLAQLDQPPIPDGKPALGEQFWAG